jgi:phage-related protein
MAENSFSAMLRELVDDVYENLIGFDEYRQRRRALLNQIDEEYNGVTSNDQHIQNDIDVFTLDYDGGRSDPDSMQTIVYSTYDKTRDNEA